MEQVEEKVSPGSLVVLHADYSMMAMPDCLIAVISKERVCYSTANGNFSVVSREWVEPDVITEEQRKAAANALGSNSWSEVMAPKSNIERFLFQLAGVVSGNLSADEAKGKAVLYSPFIHIPRALMTSELFERIAKRFGWYPSLKELSEALADEIAPWAEQRRRLLVLAR